MNRFSPGAAVSLLLSAVIAVGSVSFLGPCVHEDGSFGPCHWAGQAMLGIGLLLAVLSLTALLVKDGRLRAGLLFAAAASACLAAAEVPAPDDSGMFPFVIRPDVVGTAADMSALLDAPAGKGGFLRRDGEHFVDESGRRVRLNGVNLTGAACFPTHEEAEELKRFFRERRDFIPEMIAANFE